MADDLLKSTTDEIRARIKELEPQVAEHERLQNALRALESHTAPRRRERGRRGTQTERRTGKRAARGQRRDQLLKALGEQPGMRPSEAARAIGVQPAQLHNLARKLEEEGVVERRDGALYPAFGEQS